MSKYKEEQLETEVERLKATIKRLDNYILELNLFIEKKYGIPVGTLLHCSQCGQVHSNINSLHAHWKETHFKD